VKIPALASYLSILLLLPALSISAQDPGGAAAVGPQLARALADPASQIQDDRMFAVWVFLADRGLAPDELMRALAEAEASCRHARCSGAPGCSRPDLAPSTPVTWSRRRGTWRRSPRRRARATNRGGSMRSASTTPAQIAELARLPFVTRRAGRPVSRPDPMVSADEQAAPRPRREPEVGRLAYGGSLAGLERSTCRRSRVGNFGQGVVIGCSIGPKLTLKPGRARSSPATTSSTAMTSSSTSPAIPTSQTTRRTLDNWAGPTASDGAGVRRQPSG
jgi:hypothetical protein